MLSEPLRASRSGSAQSSETGSNHCLRPELRRDNPAPGGHDEHCQGGHASLQNVEGRRALRSRQGSSRVEDVPGPKPPN